MQFKSFHWLSHHGILGAFIFTFIFYFSFSILGAFLIKQLFYSRLLDICLLRDEPKVRLVVYEMIIAKSAPRASLNNCNYS